MSHKNDNNSSGQPSETPVPCNSDRQRPEVPPDPSALRSTEDRPHDPPDSESSLKIAHELANLLDGSLRNLGLVLSDIQDTKSVDTSPFREAEQHLARLETTNAALRQMATLVRRWMGFASTPDEVFSQSLELGQTVEQAVRLIRPAALAQGIEIHVALSEEASRLPSGPLYPVIANTLRNSIEAIADAQPARPSGERAPELIELIAQVKGGRLELIVRDTGPGFDPSLLDENGGFHFGQTTKANHHGVGLALCRDVAESLGGHIEFVNRSPKGAAFTLYYPVKGSKDR